MKSISYEQLKNTVNQTVVLFSAPWCAPCQSLKKQLADNTQTVICDVEENVDAAEFYYITSVPTVLIVENNEIKERAMGFSDCLKMIQSQSLALA